MTAVWTLRSNQNASVVGQVVWVPADFVAVGGGVVGAETPAGALATASYPYLDLELRKWTVRTQDDIYPQPHDNDAYVIGLKIEGLDVYTLRTLFTNASGLNNPMWVANPSASASVPAGFITLSGGAHGWGPWGNGQYLTASYPNVLRNLCRPWPCEQQYSVTGWTGISKDHGVSVPGNVSPYLFAIKSQFSIGGSTYHVVGSVTAAASAVAEHPSATVAGLPGEYALTGIGAYVDWQPYGWAGNLIWKLLPRPDIAGAEVASKDHGYYSPATITAYAIGIKLVPGPIPVWQPPILIGP
jgi:hypothetical protein